MTSFSDLILKRESCRSYTGESVDTSLLMKCVDAARLAPSACNSQPWKYYIVNDEKNAQSVRDCIQHNNMNKFADKCPAFAVVTEQPATLKAHIAAQVHSQKWAQNDVGISVAHYCLQAADSGLGTCIIGWLDEDMLHEKLGIPADEKIRLVIATGKPVEAQPRSKVRKPIEEICTVIK